MFNVEIKKKRHLRSMLKLKRLFFETSTAIEKK